MASVQLLLDLFAPRARRVGAGGEFGVVRRERLAGSAGAAAVPEPTGEEPAAPQGLCARALTRQARACAARLGMRKLAAEVEVRWNRRLRSTAGRADYRASAIDLNPALRDLEDAAGEVERTLLHELAHLVAHARARGRRIADHGPEWRRACADLGIAGERTTHTLELAPRREVRRRYAYACPACGSVLLRVRRLARHSACYACCRRHNRGRFHERFRLAPVPLEVAERLLAATENGAAPRDRGVR
jgi:predicted SprT family Zn-dependent metalloprotease